MRKIREAHDSSRRWNFAASWFLIWVWSLWFGVPCDHHSFPLFDSAPLWGVLRTKNLVPNEYKYPRWVDIRKKMYKTPQSFWNSNCSTDCLRYRASLLDPSPEHCGQLVCTCPCCVDIFAYSPTRTLHVAEVEVTSTAITVSVHVPPRDCHVNLGWFGDSHKFWEVVYAFLKVLGPLANNIVSDDDAQECYAHQRGKAVISGWTRQISGGTHFSPFLRSPTLFLCIRQCLEQITKTTPDTAYPAVDGVLARMRASCWDSQVLILSNLMRDQGWNNC